MPPNLQTNSCFSNIQPPVNWHGKRIIDRGEFDTYLQGKVYSRLMDEENPCVAELQALATTEMEVGYLEQLLASEQEPESWAIGEALAECLLADINGVRLPWNTARDKRTPKASLPGADLIGFWVEENDVFLLFGEVKTSNDTQTPPGVMKGGTGMIHQLEDLATNRELHQSLLKWLRPRCQQSEFLELYQAATKQYIKSRGRALVLCGLLMRDTNPDERDLKNRAQALANKVAEPMRVELTAWYCPRPIDEWPQTATGGTG
ncbi:hypothetical protein [Kamptonema sp. PCC 6506]|uniref:hypothetical protein n=1 Tax=Kamptonema sp. PCC 6506 TaxID=272129 RepID=UPI0001DAD5CE|nr:hypothetical protein [Kamptonema sp. PCC 6506]CBN55265.1 conserved hypothetical protein [Kamptonema sp. PCC 6506]